MPVYDVRLDRMTGYPHLSLAAVCKELGLPPLRPADLDGVSPLHPSKTKDKFPDAARLIKWQLMHPIRDDLDAILIANGLEQGLPADQPMIYDGRHRYVAAVLRGDATIRAWIGSPDLHRDTRLPEPVRDYLIEVAGR